jgi:hypothetical protein
MKRRKIFCASMHRAGRMGHSKDHQGGNHIMAFSRTAIGTSALAAAVSITLAGALAHDEAKPASRTS